MDMPRHKTLLPGLVITALVAAVAAWWLWKDYEAERKAQHQVLLVRGEAVLSALEGGLRSHRRLGGWFLRNVDAILEETTAAPGVLGLALLTEDGEVLGRGGRFPEFAAPSRQPVWTDTGLVVCRPMQMSDSEESYPAGFGRGRGPAWRTEEEEGEPRLHLGEIARQPLWLAVFLEPDEYHRAIGKAKRRLVASLAVTFFAIGLGVLAFGLIGRQRQLGAALGLARERENRFEEMARLGAGLAHETKNPLGLIRGLAQSLANTADAEERRRNAQRIVDESDRLVSRINSFLQYTRPPQPQLETVQLDELLLETAEIFRDEAAAKKVSIQKDLEPLQAQADPDMVRQVAVNLVANALAACEGGDTIELILRGDGTRGFALSVRDSGAGITEDDLPQVTKPYFTRRPDGAGLGLSIVRHIVEAHNWDLRIESRRGDGTTVTIRSSA